MIDLMGLDNKKKQLELTARSIIDRMTNEDSLANDIVRYVMFPGGKRLRPLLTLLIYEMLGGTKGNIYACACVPEMIHVATLMLDDLPCMDDSSYRRAIMSCHKKFGDANTILAAFGLASEAFRLLADKNNFHGIASGQSQTMSYDVAQRIGFNGLTGGQVADLNGGTTLRKPLDEKERLSYITLNKTVVLFEIAALIACCLAEASDEDRMRMITYTHHVGLALQIFDDLHDGDEDKGLSFAKIHGVAGAQQLLHEAITTAQESITATNESARILKELPQLLLKVS